MAGAAALPQQAGHPKRDHQGLGSSSLNRVKRARQRPRPQGSEVTRVPLQISVHLGPRENALLDEHFLQSGKDRHQRSVSESQCGLTLLAFVF